MKKTIVFLIIMVALWCIPGPNYADPLPHPDPYSGKLSDYEGKWIIDGKTEENTNWTLEIRENGTYHLHNEYYDYEGEIVFTPGQKDLGQGDTLRFNFDPELQIEIVLVNMADGLFEISGQGLVFVRPGNSVNVEEAELEHYSGKQLIGDWMLNYMMVTAGDFDIMLYNEDIMKFSETGDKHLILSFEDGIVYQVSEVLETRAPITYYSSSGKTVYFENPRKPEFWYRYSGIIINDTPGDFKGEGSLWIFVTPEHEESMALVLNFHRITKAPKTNKEGSDE